MEPITLLPNPTLVTTSFMVMRITETEQHKLEKVVSVKAGTDAEQKANGLAAALNASNIQSCDRYEVVPVTDEVRNVGVWHQDVAFLLIGLKQLAHRVCFQEMRKDLSRPYHWANFWQIMLGSVFDRCEDCTVLSLEQIESAVRSELERGIDLADFKEFSKEYQSRQAEYDAMAASLGLTFKPLIQGV